ncbi:hypothetical protein FI667_g15218, partial [Globisporangium splendens]
MTRNNNRRSSGGETSNNTSLTHPPASSSSNSNLTPASEPALTLTAIAQVLQDAAHFADQYGSSAAARERLELLEREQEGLNDMIVLLRTRLRQAQRATAAAESEARRHKAALTSAKAIATIASSGASIPGVNGANAREKPAMAVDPEAFVNFLKRKFACRGDMSLLQDALCEFQLQQSFPSQQPQSRERVVVLTIEEVETSIPRSSSTTLSYNVPMNSETSTSPLMDSTMSINTAAGVNDGGNDSSMGLGLISTRTFYRQSAEEEEEEIHLAAKQLLSPVTFAHVDEDDDESKTTSQSLPQPPPPPPQRTFVPILAHEKQDELSTLKPSVHLCASPHELDGSEQKLKKLLPKKPRVKKTPRAPSPSPSSPAGAIATIISNSNSLKKAATAAAPQYTEADTKEPSVQPEPASKKRKINVAEESLVIKQNLIWPAERRNITEMKHSSRFLSLRALEELDRQTPWNEMYKRRPLFSHILNYQELDERAKSWFVSTLKIQFIWRRELWERLHWLPMSESVCTGAAWEKYRQTRKRRAKHAVTAWRKIYAQSIQMIEAGILPDDIWCDPALWYMPANPIYWLPESDDVATELLAIDDKHAVRCYHVYDLARHPFYEQRLVDKYPHRYELPSFSPSSTSTSARDGGEGNSMRMQGEEFMDETPAPEGLILADVAPPPPPMSTAVTKAKLLTTKDAAPSVKKQRGPRAQKVTQQKLVTPVVVPKVKITAKGSTVAGAATGSEAFEAAKAS